MSTQFLPAPLLLTEKFALWTAGEDTAGAIRNIYRMVRDIPYAVVPELIDAEAYVRILETGRGSCTPKHFLLCRMYQMMGLTVLYSVFPFRWADAQVDYPPHLRKMARAMPVSHHLCCRVELGGRLVLVDATLDPPLKSLGLPVNSQWDGASDNALPVSPCGEEQLHHPCEATLVAERVDHIAMRFYTALNAWLDRARRRPGQP